MNAANVRSPKSPSSSQICRYRLCECGAASTPMKVYRGYRRFHAPSPIPMPLQTLSFIMFTVACQMWTLYDVDESERFPMLVNLPIIDCGRTDDRNGRDIIPANTSQRERLCHMNIITTTASISPSHAPRLHVRIRQEPIIPRETKALVLRIPSPRPISIAKATGIIRIRYSPSIFGFSSEPTARPPMDVNISLSSQACDEYPPPVK